MLGARAPQLWVQPEVWEDIIRCSQRIQEVLEGIMGQATRSRWLGFIVRSSLALRRQCSHSIAERAHLDQRKQSTANRQIKPSIFSMSFKAAANPYCRYAGRGIPAGHGHKD
jgi:hypothetical protein